MKENFTSIPSRSRLELCHLALETHDLELLGLHLAVARESMLRVLGQLLHPIAQLRRVNVQVLRRLHIGHASILDQAHGFKLELSRKLPSLHDPPPAPSKHLTRCLRNRVQATASFLVDSTFDIRTRIVGTSRVRLKTFSNECDVPCTSTALRNFKRN